jgi:hypothetical protein
VSASKFSAPRACLPGPIVRRTPLSAHPSKHPVDVKRKIVLSVLRSESTQAGAARHGASETSIGKPT